MSQDTDPYSLPHGLFWLAISHGDDAYKIFQVKMRSKVQCNGKNEKKNDNFGAMENDQIQNII